MVIVLEATKDVQEKHAARKLDRVARGKGKGDKLAISELMAAHEIRLNRVKLIIVNHYN